MTVSRGSVIALGAAHRGYALKEQLRTFLAAQGYAVRDCGADALVPDDDYPLYARAVACTVARGDAVRGIVLCGSGSGVCIAANKVDGIRAGTALSLQQVRDATAHDHLNILCISADYMDAATAHACVDVFLATAWSDVSRHVRRVAQIMQLEEATCDE